MEKIKQKLLDLAEKKVKEKLKEEKKQNEIKIKSEIKDVEFILELIEKKMLYKKIGDNWDKNQKFILITKEIFFEDYIKEPKESWVKKLQVKKSDNWSCDYYTLSIEVNGEKYYHIGLIIKDFEQTLKKKIDRIKNITDRLYELEEDFEQLKNQEQNIKKFVEDYNKTNELLNNTEQH